MPRSRSRSLSQTVALGCALLSMPLFCGAIAGVGLGCKSGPKPIIIKGPVVQAVADARWRTMQAEHRVVIDAPKGDGRETTTVRGLIAIERPDRFRLRAMLPGGITLFDIIKVGGETRIVKGVGVGDSSLQQKVLLSIGADLAAAYDLEPKLPYRTKDIGFKEGELRIVEPERSIRCQQFKEVQGQSVPTRIIITNSALDYTVTIDVESAILDVKLDPNLFRTTAG